MKVLHLNSLDSGGAAKAVDRINCSLNEKINSEIFFFKDRNKFFRNLLSKPYSVADKIISGLNNKIKNTTFSSNLVPFSFIPFIIKKKNPDLVHLHWINAGMISINDLLKIKKPIVWTMHDYWPFSGGYHYPVNNMQSNNPLDIKIFEKKKEVFNKIKNIIFIAVSKKLMEEAKKSSLLINKNISFINNPLNNKFFNKKNKIDCRSRIGLNDKFSILFCSNNSVYKENKNFHFLVKVLNKFSEINKFNFIICGERSNVKESFDFSNRINVIETGFINSEKELSIIYNAADLTIVPSKKEAFGQVASESFACGTPVIGIKNTGLDDIIVHRENGYLCNEANIDEFLNAIKWIQIQNKETIIKRCQSSVLKFSYENISDQYIEIYKKILNQ